MLLRSNTLSSQPRLRHQMSLPSLSAAEICTRCLLRAPNWQPRIFTRSVSRTSAINRGIRASSESWWAQGRNGVNPRRARKEARANGSAEWDAFTKDETMSSSGIKKSHLSKPRENLKSLSSRRADEAPKTHRGSHNESTSTRVSGGSKNRVQRDGKASIEDSAAVVEAKPRKEEQRSEQQPEEDDDDDGVPVAVPYTTAASQFIYGHNAVEAALRGKRRQFHQLLIKRQKGGDSPKDRLVHLAREMNIPVNYAKTSLLEKLSEGRPHNGVALEASALPTPSVIQFGRPNIDTFNVRVMTHGSEPDPTLKYNGYDWRQPFVLFLDGITDPGNVGGIIRTAHFYGVDAIVVAVNTCANLNSPVMAKASAGACEALPIFETAKPSDFIFRSAKAGWRICAAVAPDTRSDKLYKQSSSATLALTSPLARTPCILMLGSEGEGLRENLRSKADLEVTIERGTTKSGLDVGVDSINVGVAAGILIDSFMRKPNDMRMPKDQSPEDVASDRIFRLPRSRSASFDSV